MRHFILALITLTLLVSSTTTSMASNRQVESLFLGGAGGALEEQAIGHNVEATIVGATIGSVLGLVINTPVYHQVRYHRHPVPVRSHYYHKAPRVYQTPVYYRPSHIYRENTIIHKSPRHHKPLNYRGKNKNRYFRNHR